MPECIDTGITDIHMYSSDHSPSSDFFLHLYIFTISKLSLFIGYLADHRHLITEGNANLIKYPDLR